MYIEFEHPWSSVTGAFAPDGTLVTTCTEFTREPEIRESQTFQWDAKTFDQVCDAIDGRFLREFSPDGSQFLCTTPKSHVAAYEIGTVEPVYELSLIHI